MSFITDLPVNDAVLFFANQAMKHHPETDTLEKAIQRGKNKAIEAFEFDGKYTKVVIADMINVSDFVKQCSLVNGIVYDSEPGDSGSHYDDYRANKQRRRNGLYQ